jgi:hypothetical protein
LGKSVEVDGRLQSSEGYVARLDREPTISALEVLTRLELARPNRFTDRQLTTVQRAEKTWRGQQARRIIAESAALIIPETRVADRALPEHSVRHRRSSRFGCLGFLRHGESYPEIAAWIVRRVPGAGLRRRATGPSE